jgi:hypothetical protein
MSNAISAFTARALALAADIASNAASCATSGAASVRFQAFVPFLSTPPLAHLVLLMAHPSSSDTQPTL